jgi:hypothetical protein
MKLAARAASQPATRFGGLASSGQCRPPTLPFPILPSPCEPFPSHRVTGGGSFLSGIAIHEEAACLRGHVKHVTSPDIDSDPVVAIYREDEGLDRVISLIAARALNLDVLSACPHLMKGLPPATAPNPAGGSLLRRLSGRTLLDPRPPQEAAEALGFLYLDADDVAINPNMGFILMRVTPIQSAPAEGRARTCLLWEAAPGAFDCMHLRTDVVQIAQLRFGDGSKSRPWPPVLPSRPRRRPVPPRREVRSPK